jgi:hypothetical protein
MSPTKRIGSMNSHRSLEIPPIARPEGACAMKTIGSVRQAT